MIEKSPQALALPALLALVLGACAPVTEPRPEASPAVRAFAAADSLRVQTVAPGVLYIRAWERTGPWAIHVVEMDTARCTPRWSTRKPAGTLDARGLTSALAGDALAGVNADFFQLPGGTPVGPQVAAGADEHGPGERPAWLWNGRAMALGDAVLVGNVGAGNDSLPLAQVNRAARTVSSYQPPATGADLFTALAPALPPADSVGDVVLLEVTSTGADGGTG
ncbi:MAG: hypothetical protein FIB01_09345, partial [Gemmatimonadetes bacterium]|nr:hypothetical protein [Gemmatimonadota bacterium]